MKPVFWLMLICFTSCKEHHPSQTIALKQVFKSPETIVPKESYTDCKNNISRLRKLLKNKYPVTTNNIATLQKEFVSVLVDSVFSYWYGTAWDFNGATQQPGKGSIACGYFVTTVLEDAGVALQRVKLAQCASQKIIDNLISTNPKKVFSNVPCEKFLEYIKQQGYGIYIVGLDFHVGFLYNDGTIIYFIHAKWIHPKAVVKEVAIASSPLYYSYYRIVGKLSDDPQFLKRWLQ